MGMAVGRATAIVGDEGAAMEIKSIISVGYQLAKGIMDNAKLLKAEYAKG